MGVEKQLLIFSSCLTPGPIKKLHTFINFCLKFGNSATVKHSKSAWEQRIFLWKVQNQNIKSSGHNARSALLDRGTETIDLRQLGLTVVVLISGRFRAKPTNYERRLHRSDTFAYRSAHDNLFPPYATRNPQVKKDIARTISTQWYGIRLKLVNTRLKL